MNPMSGGPGTVEGFAAHAAATEQRRVEAVERHKELHAQPDGFHYASDAHEEVERQFLASLVEQHGNIHSALAVNELALFRAGKHPTQTAKE